MKDKNNDFKILFIGALIKWGIVLFLFWVLKTMLFS